MEKHEIVHVLMTRFNLATGGREAAHRRSPGWLERRFEIFEKHCLPSVASQDDQEFVWIIFFDQDTPAWARQRIEAARGMREFQPSFTELFDAHGWARAVRTVIGPPRRHRRLVTSNLDNDDGLARDYMARVRRTARARETPCPFAVNVPEGVVLSGNATYRHRHLHNAFTNLVENDDHHVVTTMAMRHMELPERVAVIQSEGGPGWLQFVHNDNVSNRIRGTRVDPRALRPAFHDRALDGTTAPSRSQVWADTLVAPLRTARDEVFSLVRRFIRVEG